VELCDSQRATKTYVKHFYGAKPDLRDILKPTIKLSWRETHYKYVTHQNVIYSLSVYIYSRNYIPVGKLYFSYRVTVM
jgi:hypothetical protein